MKIRLVTVIWGAPFVDLFLRVCIRSLMAEGNLPELARRHQCTYTLYTTAADFKLIEASPEFARLRELVKIEVSLFGLGEINASNRGSHTVLWNRGLELARRNHEILFLIIPDLLYGTGTLLRWAQRFEEGWHAVYTPGPFVALETALPEVEREFLGDDGVITLNPDKILPFLLRHLHPVECGMFRDAPRRTQHPEHDLRAIPGRGFVMRVFTSQPFSIDPNHFLKITHFNVEDHVDDICFEPFSTISLEPTLKTLEWLYRPNRLGDTRVTRLGAWWEPFSTRGSITESRHVYKFLLSDGGEETDRACERATAGGRFFRAQLYAALVTYRLWEWVAKAGEFWPAVFLATAQLGGRLRRRLLLRGDPIVFVPRSSAFDQGRNSWVWEYLKPGRERDLVNFIRAHVFTKTTGDDGVGRWTSGRGEDLAIAGSRVRIDGEAHQISGLTVYFVDDLMAGPDLSTPNTAVEPSGDTAEPAACDVVAEMSPAVAKKDWPEAAQVPLTKHRRSLRLPRRASIVSFFRRAVNKSLRLLGKALRAVWSILAWICWATGRIIYWLFFSVILLFRGVGRVVAMLLRWLKGYRTFRAPIRALERAQSVYETEGWAGLWLRYRSRFPHRAFVAESMVRRVRYASRPVERLVRLIRRGIVFAQQNGIRAAIARGMTLFTWLEKFDIRTRLKRLFSSKPNENALRELDRIRNVRGLMALEDVLSHYQKKVLDDEIASAPLELIRSCLAERAETPEGVSDLIKARLETLGQRYPRFAECWWELGIHCVDRQEVDAAKAAFEKCYSGVLFLGRPPGTTDCRALALEEAGRLYLNTGDPETARQLFVRACELEPTNGAFNLSLARAERQIGEERSAARNFFWAMGYHNLGYHVPSSVRDMMTLEVELAAE